MRILIIGGWGQLGTDLAAAAANHEIDRPAHGEVDVTSPGSIAAVVSEFRPDVLINTAAFHKVELCEVDPVTALAVNATGAWNVAVAARSTGIRTVFVSTDYVFDGARSDSEGYREDDPVAPVNVYGISKAAGERLVRLADPSAMVVRGSGLFGHAGSAGKGGNFVDNMIARARSGQSLTIVDDQVFAPTSTHDMATRIIDLLEAGAPAGTYHAANTGACSWFEFATEACRLAGVDADIAPRRTGSDAPKRPERSVLIDTKGPAIGLPPARSWRDALAWYLNDDSRSAASPGPATK